MKKFLIILGGVAVGCAVLGILVVVIMSLSSKKLKCQSTQGDITIMYNDDGIVGYSANGVGFELDEQQDYAKQIGIEDYLDEFEEWFEDNAGGTCSR